jgi:hypothetical protein
MKGGAPAKKTGVRVKSRSRISGRILAMKSTSVALDHFLCAVGDPAADVRGIGPDHPEFDRAQMVRAAVGVLAKSPDALPALARVLEAGAGPAASPRTRAHLAAAQAWLSGDPVHAAEAYVSILRKWPHDLLAVRLAQSCWFFLGRHERACAVIDMVMPAWTPDRPGFHSLLAMAAFAYAESGDAERAETLGRMVLAVEPSCPMGVHAVAHAFAESGRHREGAQWMRDQRAHWHTGSRMCTHNAWHLAMFDAEQGDFASALAILDKWLLPASESSTIEACDATGLLWRLTTEGVDDAGRWKRISDAFARRLAPGYWPFIDVHAALAHRAAGEPERARDLVEAIERVAKGADHAAHRARTVTLPAVRALLSGREPSLLGAGGSRVQLSVARRALPPRGGRQTELALERPVERRLGLVADIRRDAEDREVTLAE